MALDKNKINAPHIILCEGNDACIFMINMLVYLCKNDSFFERFDVKDFGGVTELSEKLSVLMKMPDFNKVKSILVVRDAETDFAKAKSEIAQAFIRQGMEAPNRPGEIVNVNEKLKIAYLLFPSLDEKGDENGTLEHLCLKISKCNNKDSVLEDVERFLEDEHEKHGLEYPRIHKNRIHLFMSLFDKYVGCKIGEAGKIGLYDWENNNLYYLKEVMRKMGG